ncbi:concanavalin A-like lectin/glucanase domain-containing protein [Aspergillus pseudocaelatus]|uniref:Endo-1,4-beta-xylanase n=1 Tax=Aspergillus pseudocaelatus TaxID=1825620 RepID=A0ABQ6WUX7_9EURO|nr:concanavalin A-like lectin/glucanase domain-containing protein [Aspergillus pseudocaelatus]
MVSASRLLFFLPVLGVLATPTDSTTPQAVARSPEFLEHTGALIANATGDANVERRDGTFKTSKDGVDAAGFYYSLYNANGAGAEYSEFENSGQFKVSWNTKHSLSWDGQFQAEGDFTLAVYGWTTDPVTEWYVVEAHGTGTPGNGHILGQVETDGGVYDVYMLPYRNVPEIYGVTSFNQLWSVRREARHTGTVDAAAHFKRWQELGLKPGNPVFQMVTAEGFKGSGKLDFTLRK